MSRPWTDAFRAELEVLLGKRGPRAKAAVLWGEVDKIYSGAAALAAKAVQEGGGTDPGTGGTTPEELENRVDELEAAAIAASNQAQAAALAAQAVREDHDALVDGFVGKLTDAFAEVEDLATMAVARGWVKDPTISEWADGLPAATNWSHRSGLTGYATQFTGRWGGGLSFVAPASGGAAHLIATSGAGLNGAQIAQHVVATIAVQYESGASADPLFRAEWSADGSAWVSGTRPGGLSTTFAALGIAPTPGVVQLREFLFTRPAGTFSQIRLRLTLRNTATAQDMKIHLVDLREATEAEIAAAQVPGVQASITQQAATLTGLGASIAQLQADLTAEVSGVYSHLGTNYMTAAQTNNAIAAAGLTLSSRIDTVETTANSKGKTIYSSTPPAVADRLAQNLWIDTAGNANTPKRWNGTAWVAVTDKAALDAAAVAASVAADLSTNYLTSAATGQAIAAAETRMSASIDDVSASVQGFQAVLDQTADVTAGAAASVSLGGAALGQANTLIVKDTSAARITSGATNGASVTISTHRALLFSGQRIKIGVLARRPTSNPASRFAVAFSTADNGNSGAMLSGALSTAWQWHIFHYDVPVAIGGGPSYLGIFGDHDGAGRAVQVARVYVEIAAVAGELPEINSLAGEITDIKGLDLSRLSGTAMGTLLSQLAVQANGSSATISAQGTAIATLQGNASASYVFRVKAGTAGAGLELVAATNPNGPVSVARISATDILLDGSVAAQQLVVTDFSGNLVLNGAMPYGDTRGWGPMPTTFAVVPRDPNSPYGPVKTAPLPYLLFMNPDVNPRFVVVGEFTCEAGDRFVAQYNAAAAVAQGTNIGIQFVWIGADGQQITTTSRSTVINYAGWQKIVTPVVAAPSGAAKCILRAIRWGDSSASIGLLSNMEVVKQRTGATLITPYSVTAGLLAAEELITLSAQIGDGIITRAHLGLAIIGRAQIEEAAIDTLRLAGNAVVVPAATYQAGNVSVSDPYALLAQLSITRVAGQPTRIGFCCRGVRSVGDFGSIGMSLRRDGLQIFDTEGLLVSDRPTILSFFFVDTDLSGGASTYEVYGTRTYGSTITINRRSLEAHIYKR